MNPPHPPVSGQSGFTLVEVMVAITILLVGVLGVVAMVDGANAISSRNKAREGSTNVARSIVEVGRAVPYRDLETAKVYEALKTRPGLADSHPLEGHTVESRGFHYTVSLQVCSMDDPKDGLGANDPAIVFCPESDHAATASDVKDRNPDDLKRIAVTLTWTRNGNLEKAKQTSLITNPVGGLGPSVTLDAPAFPGATKIVKTETNQVRFVATTSTDAAQVEWAVSGARQGKASQIGASKREWDFLWVIDGGTPQTRWPDCTYVVQAEAFDDKGRSGKPGALTVVLNRSTPTAPPFLEGGRNGNGTSVDLRWQKPPDCDVLGYRVFHGPTASGPWTKVKCTGQTNSDYTTETACLDEAAPGTDPLYYRVVAVDTDTGSSVPRDGSASILPVLGGNTVPTAPTDVHVCRGGLPGCNGPDGESAPDGSLVVDWDPSTDPDGIAFYRIYRDGDTYANRFDIFFPTSTGNLIWIDPETPDGSGHTYRVSAVDTRYGESELSASVTIP